MRAGRGTSFTSRPATVASLARSGGLIDLGGYLDVAGLRSAMGDQLVQLGTVPGPPPGAGGLYGLPVAISSGSLIWYPKDAFEAAGYGVPQTWTELLALSRRIVADGGTPWCLGTEDGASSGASLTDWVEELVLHDAGPAFYDAWTDHLEKFDSGRVGSAFADFGEIVSGVRPRAAGVSRSGLNPDVAERSFSDHAAVRHAVKSDAAGQAEIIDVQLLAGRPGQAAYDFLGDFLDRACEGHVALSKRRFGFLIDRDKRIRNFLRNAEILRHHEPSGIILP